MTRSPGPPGARLALPQSTGLPSCRWTVSVAMATCCCGSTCPASTLSRSRSPWSDKFFVRERTFGTFTRRLNLSKNLNADAVEAAYNNGVLEVRIPVLEQAKPRKVEVRQGDESKELAA
jgi:hypothetical protein